MIEIPTLLILGAGASKPYGYPTGLELTKLIVDDLAEIEHNESGWTYDLGYDMADLVSTFRFSLDMSKKQSINSLINEFKINLEIYEGILKGSEKEIKLGKYNNFIFTNLEKSLYNSPIDNSNINKLLLDIYYVISIHDKKLTATREANITDESLTGHIEAITTNYKEIKPTYNHVLNLLIEYEQNFKI